MKQPKESSQQQKLNLKQFKRHERRFPWALVIRITVALITIGMIFYLSEIAFVRPHKKSNDEFQFEIEYDE